MPWTLSHPAAALPFRRLTPQRLDFTALVLGSMTPDLGYYIGWFDLANLAHTLSGSFIACLPSGVALLLIFHLVCKPVCYALPAPHRQSLRPLCPDFPPGPARWAILLFSLLLGAWTHNFWDAFTHEHGWFVERLGWLQQPVVQLQSMTVHTFLVLQELSTLFGFAIVVFVYGRWLRRQPPAPAGSADPDTWRYLFWTAILGLSLAFSVPTAAHYEREASLHGFRLFRSLVFRIAIYTPRAAVPLALIGTTIIYAQHRRTVGTPSSQSQEH